MTASSYATLANAKERLDIPASDTANDARLTAILAAASRQVDGLCNRRDAGFFSETATRVYDADRGDYLAIDDLVSVTTLKTDQDGDRTYETTWLTTDYDLEPANAAVRGFPYTAIRTAPRGTQWFPTQRRGVQIVGTWGWAAVPEPVAEACLLITTRIYRRPTLPFGLAGSPELGQLTDLPAVDPDVRTLLLPFRRFVLVPI